MRRRLLTVAIFLLAGAVVNVAVAWGCDRIQPDTSHGQWAINTLFYSIMLWLLIAGPFVFRWFIRLRRGLCPNCAYPMGESAVCNECGNELPKRVRPAT